MKTNQNLKLKRLLGSDTSAEPTQPNTTDTSISTVQKSNLKILAVVKKTSVGRHAWVKAETPDGKVVIVKKETKNIPQELLAQ